MIKNKKNNKLWVLMTASILAVLAVFGLLVLYNNNHISYSYYHKKLAQFKQENETIEFCDVVFLGDSLTDGYSLKAHYPKYAMLNRGIGGDTTQGVIERLEESVFKVEPKVVVLLIGGNDVARDRSNDYILYNYKIIINNIKSKLPNTKIIMQSMYPLGAEFMAKHEIMKYLNKFSTKELQEKFPMLIIKNNRRNV